MWYADSDLSYYNYLLNAVEVRIKTACMRIDESNSWDSFATQHDGSLKLISWCALRR